MPSYIINKGQATRTVVFAEAAASESNVVKFDISAEAAIDGKAVVRYSINKIKWSVFGQGVSIRFNRSTPQVVAICAGTGSKEAPAVVDNGTGGTGDIEFTTTPGGAGTTYWIEVEVGLHTA